MDAIAAAPLPVAEARPNRKLERIFFAGMSLLLLATVLFGFARTYFLAGMVTAPLPNKLIHIHGFVFTMWIAFLLVQTALVTTKKIRVHRALGIYGFLWAVLMVILGPLAAVDQLHRGHAPFGMDPRVFFIIPMTAIGMFALFIAWSWTARRNPAAHKRLIMLGTIVICDAAIGRWPIAALQAHPPLQGLVILGFVLLIAAFDLITMHKIHRITAWGFLMIAVEQFTRVPIGHSKLWMGFADFILRHKAASQYYIFALKLLVVAVAYKQFFLLRWKEDWAKLVAACLVYGVTSWAPLRVYALAILWLVTRH